VPEKIINKGINDLDIYLDSKHVGYLVGLLVLYYFNKKYLRKKCK